jgi:hypothetical protein
MKGDGEVGGVPRRDVDGRVHVRVADEAAGSADEPRFDGQVPDVPGVAAVIPQHRLLGGHGVEPVPGHTNTLSGTADISGEVKRRFLPGLKADVSTPRS